MRGSSKQAQIHPSKIYSFDKQKNRTFLFLSLSLFVCLFVSLPFSPLFLPFWNRNRVESWKKSYVHYHESRLSRQVLTFFFSLSLHLLVCLLACSLFLSVFLSVFSSWTESDVFSEESLAHSLAPELMGKRFMSMNWMRQFHTVSDHCASVGPSIRPSIRPVFISLWGASGEGTDGRRDRRTDG